MKSFALLLLSQRLLLKYPVHIYFFVQNLLPIHVLDSLIGLIEVAELDQSVALDVSSLSIEVEVQTFDLSEFREGVEEIIFLYLLIEVCYYEYPTFNSWIRYWLHLMGKGDSLGTVLDYILLQFYTDL